ncbi:MULTISPECIES: ABC transporter substrate-binding protein [Pseudomonas]|jgi:NitT/TauT family transport system substrate-binding protein|uniref:Twin-arginine translocation signal domain-containing protein n=2 Tax=Pseudomonas fluorescens group TaxID=136843 RepID=A0A9X9FVL0_PSEMA|nr:MULTISPECIES: ABC transporter substrate-binding protein [Pseudomonas]MDT9634536.1 twin-arginine translocation signal domain-containing protein [Pseudomonas sp. JV449]OCW20660.1 ABC transporter substrate-binding protein [Pseudomonas sp. S3E12]QDH65624.1 twin-arginine translocation signal domain-containing protein [Pseudomonas azotoformans]RDS89993.1 ABC transporter substrate-binding protein [Pseudomonas fluorescens]TKJ78580.1 ABC transporter substrate-binding protein [Pseudomonas sp. CFBP135
MCLDDLTHSRRDFLKLSAVLSAAGALPLLSSLQARAASEPDAPVRIGYLPITDATPLLVAHNNGLFEAEGIKAERPVLLRSWAQVIEAFISGQVNVIHLLSPMTVWARYGSQVPAKVVAWNHVGGSGLTVAPGITEVKQLGGKSVAIPFWYSIHNVVVQQLFRDNGLTPVARAAGSAIGANEVNLIVLPPSDMPPALASQRIDGYIVAEPFNALAENLKVGRVQRFTGDVWRNHACCVVFMHEHDLNNRPEWSQKVVNAIVKAQVWTRDNRAEAVKLLSKDGPNRYTPHAEPVLSKVLAPAAADRAAYLADGAIRHADWDEHRIDFQPYPFPSYTEELVRRLKDTLIEGDKKFLADLDPAFVAKDLVDDRFVRNAIEAVGGMGTFGLPEGFERTEEIGV